MDTKTCTKCGEEKLLDEYSHHPQMKDGRNPSCKLCVSAYQKQWGQRSEVLAAKAAFRQSDAGKLLQRKVDLKRRYGISIDRYWEMFHYQNGVCAICRKPPLDPLSLCVDHDHSCCPGRKACGKCIRGLLCEKCNIGLGGFLDKLTLLLSAIRYILLWRKPSY